MFLAYLMVLSVYFCVFLWAPSSSYILLQEALSAIREATLVALCALGKSRSALGCAEAASPLSSSLCRLNADGEKRACRRPLGDSAFCFAFKRGATTSRQRLNYTVCNERASTTHLKVWMGVVITLNQWVGLVFIPTLIMG